MEPTIVRGVADPISGDPVAGGYGPEARFHDLGFEHRYACEVRPSTADDKDGAIPLPTPPSPGQAASMNCLIVRIEPAGGKPWKAVVHGDPGIDAFPVGVFATPDPEALLIVRGGSSLLVRARGPEGSEGLGGYTTGLVAVPDLRVLAVVGHDTITGLGPKGRVWKTKQLSMCCLRLKALEDGVLGGDAENTDSRDVPFRVDLRDGSHEGGWGL